MLQKTELEYGYIGSSKSSHSINAIVWAGGEDFYFYPVSPWEASALDRWLEEGKSPSALPHILRDCPEDLISAFTTGEVNE